MEQSCNWEERAFDVMEQFNVFPPPPGPPMGMASPRVSPPQQSPQGKTLRVLTQSLLPLSLNGLGVHPKGLFPSSIGDGCDQASGCVPMVASRCQGRSDSLAMQGSVASAVSKGTLEHVTVLFAQEQPGAPG